MFESKSTIVTLIVIELLPVSQKRSTLKKITHGCMYIQAFYKSAH